MMVSPLFAAPVSAARGGRGDEEVYGRMAAGDRAGIRARDEVAA
jgi:hypothetical protein